MSTFSEEEVETILDESREQSSVGNFPDALRTLKKISENSPSFRGVLGEIFRICIILGDHKQVIEKSTSTCAAAVEGEETYNDLLAIQIALSRVSIDGELARSLELASPLFQKYENELGSEDLESETHLVLYYCLEIRYFWKLYGDGIPDPLIDYDGIFLQHLIHGLTKEGLYFEALELLEHFVQDPEPQLEAMAAALLVDAGTGCLIRLATIHGKNGDFDEVEEILKLVDELLESGDQLPKLHCELITQRFLGIPCYGPTDRIDKLIQLSSNAFDLGAYNTALQALEYAAEIQCTLPSLEESREQVRQIHSRLNDICDSNHDHLSQLLFQFRNCDVLNSVDGNLSAAIAQRNDLVSTTLSLKLPYFQSFHRRQWAEYFLLGQREEALHHAKIYLDYCRKYRSPEEQSLAENIQIQTQLQPSRMSEEARESLLEDLQRQLERGIESDKTNGWLVAQIEKQVLLIELWEELGRIQVEEAEGIASMAVEVLDDAASTCENVEWNSENMFLKFEIILLQGAASDLSGKDVHSAEVAKTSLFICGANAEPSPHQNFQTGRSFQELMFAIRNESLPGFQHVFTQLCQYVDQLNQDHDFLKRAEVLNFKGLVYYFLMECENTEIRRFWDVVGFKSFAEGAELALQCFEEALTIHDEIGEHVAESDKTEDRIKRLAAAQSYVTGASRLQIFDIALEMASGLEDKKRTWEWIQRSKAQALSKLLRSTLDSDQVLKGPDYLEFSAPLKFEDLQYIQTASARKLIFVDWISFGLAPHRLLFFSFSMGRDETGPIAEMEMEEMEADFEDLKEAACRITDARMDGADASEYLRPFIPVIQPLVNSSEPGDILVLSLTAPLHAVPLHAVAVEESLLLIERNPILYVPSQASLLSCLQRLSAPAHGAEAPKMWQASVLGAYDDDTMDPETAAERSQIYSSLETLAKDLDTKAIVGPSLTKSEFERHSSQANLLHFHGHSLYNIHDPEQSSIILGNFNDLLTIPDIAALKLHATHVTMIACSGAVQDFSLSGDEPLGILSSFLLGGASSVIGALWPVQSSTGRLFTRIFYDYFLHHVDRTELGPIVNLAMALQHTVLDVMKKPGTGTPYHWAPFVLYGAWFCRRKPGSW